MTQQEIDYGVDQIFDLIGKAQAESTAEMKGFYMNSIYISLKDMPNHDKTIEEINDMTAIALNRYSDKERKGFGIVTNAVMFIFSPYSSILDKS